MAAALGCGSNTLDGGQHPQDPGPTTCYQPEGAIAPVAECARTALCLAPSDTTLITPANCTDATCLWSVPYPPGDTLAFTGPDTTVYLMFSAPVTGATSTQDLTSRFKLVSFSRTYPVIGGANALTATYGEQRNDLSGFDAFELADGVLRVKLSFTIHDPYATITSTDPLCNYSDISNMCFCSYGVANLPGTIDITLPATL
jgi:hypothetical protein